MGCHVIGFLGWAAGIQPAIGIVLRLEQRFRKRRVRLPQHDDIGAGRVALSLGRERLQRGANLDAATPKDAEHRAQPNGVLACRDHIGVWPVTPPAYRARFDVEEICEPPLTRLRGVRQQRVRAFRLVRHDIP